MARVVLCLILTFLLNPSAYSALEKSFAEGYLGEKSPALYYGPWRPEFHHDPYFGRTTWDDESFFSGQLYPYVWSEAPEWGRFFGEELIGASTCPHPELSRYFDEMRYAHRLLAMSYLLEVMDSVRSDMELLRQNGKNCGFDLQELLRQCKPQSDDMKTFISNLATQAPYSAPVIDKTHNFAKYEREWLDGVAKIEGTLASMRTGLQCKLEKKLCSSTELAEGVKVTERACAADRALFLSICSEADQLYGVSTAPLATYLLGISNLVTLFNVEGHAQGCLRRFGQMMAGKEHHYPVHSALMPLVYATLKTRYGQRYPHGRAFVFGALKEFQQKGLTNIFEPKVEKPTEPVVATKPVDTTPAVKATVDPGPAVAVSAKPAEKVKIQEVPIEVKSAFLQAAEVRAGQNLERVDVDMLKFSYDHVFSSTEMKLLGSSLKVFTERKALEEMRQYDKLGTREGPVPLTFVKFLIDDQNHQGLFNLTGVLKEKFWVMNDIDSKFKPAIEFAELKNDASTGNTWQLYILRAEE